LAIYYCIPRVIDTVRAYNFHAPANIVAIDTRLKFTARGTDIFYASSPQIDSQQEFNNNCGTQERTSAILGCFYKDTIYLYDLKNSELDGTLEVTAAHEMLHAAYQRLSVVERLVVDQMIKEEYEKVKDNSTIKELMSYYSTSEPGEEINELHSILGTTIATLSPNLEHYYSRYFKDRAVVVSLNAQYNRVFAQLNAQTDELEKKLAASEPEITQLLSQYDADRTELETDVANFNARAKAGQFSSQTTFNNERDALLGRITELNKRQATINAKVAEYNADVKELNTISTHTNELYQSMNGATATGALQY
jgi:hypothetical protein